MLSRLVLQNRYFTLKIVKTMACNISISSINYNNQSVLSRCLKENQRCNFSQELGQKLITVDYDYVKKAVDNKNIVIVDVREPEELKEYGYIPTSINIPLGNIQTVLNMEEKDFKNVFNITKPKEDTEIIFYCMIGKRSGRAQQEALNLGYKNASNYVGSWTDWASKSQ